MPFGYVYGIQSGLFIKVGMTKNIRLRLREMNLYNPHPCKVVVRRRCEHPRAVEKRIHELLAKHAIGREWFVATPQQVREAASIAQKEERNRLIELARREKEEDERGNVSESVPHA